MRKYFFKITKFYLLLSVNLLFFILSLISSNEEERNLNLFSNACLNFIKSNEYHKH